MKIIPPNLPIGQSFGANADGDYKAAGLAGHPGIDFGSGANYGQPVQAVVDGAVVSALLSKENPNLDAYRAVNTIFEDNTGCYEIQYGHVMQEVVKVGDVILLGQEVATLGNTGDVFAGTPPTIVTEAQKESGSHLGAHIHLQVRIIEKEPATSQISPSKHYLNDGVGLLTLNGYRYYQLYPDNGYASCVDPEPYFQTETDDLTSVVKDEVGVLNMTTDPSVRQSLAQLIAQQIKKLFGYD